MRRNDAETYRSKGSARGSDLLLACPRRSRTLCGTSPWSTFTCRQARMEPFSLTLSSLSTFRPAHLGPPPLPARSLAETRWGCARRRLGMYAARRRERIGGEAEGDGAWRWCNSRCGRISRCLPGYPRGPSTTSAYAPRLFLFLLKEKGKTGMRQERGGRPSVDKAAAAAEAAGTEAEAHGTASYYKRHGPHTSYSHSAPLHLLPSTTRIVRAVGQIRKRWRHRCGASATSGRREGHNTARPRGGQVQAGERRLRMRQAGRDGGGVKRRTAASCHRRAQSACSASR